MTRWSRMLATAVLLSVGLPSISAMADNYPYKPIRMIVAWPAGGVADSATRRLAGKLTEELGQQVVVENKPGASGMIGADLVARAAPDGYTLLRGDAVTHGINPSVFATISYDPIKDFTPISLHGRGMMVLLAHPSLGVSSLRDVIALSKSRPDGIQIASPGLGTGQHLSAALLGQTTGANLAIVPYKGEGPALIDVAAGQVPLTYAYLGPALPLVQAGKLKAIVLTGDVRPPAYADTPTVAEVGFPELEMKGWGIVLAPAGTPRPIVDKLNAAIVKVMKSPEIVELLRTFGSDAFTSTPEEAAAFVRSEIARFAPIVKKAGIRLE